MLKVFYGTDQIKVRQAAHLAITDLLTPDKEFIRLEADKFTEGMMIEAISSTSLFNPGTVYLVDLPDTNNLFYQEFLGQIEAVSNSSNDFVVILQKLNAEDKRKVSKYTKFVEEYKKLAEKSFNPFSMADALSVRDKKSLWILFQEAKRNGLSAEEIIGTFWWQLKSIRLAAVTKTPEEAGMKDYPYKKAKSALNTFKLPEVEKKSRELLRLYHEGHQGVRDIDLALEEWVLTL
jgi:DNA polymerase III delta subunit